MLVEALRFVPSHGRKGSVLARQQNGKMKGPPTGGLIFIVRLLCKLDLLIEPVFDR
jgi:hypothetical protein